MALQNIGASNSDDAFYRYKMPKMITKIEGRGNGIKTNVVNMLDIAKALHRPASYTTKYFGCELGAQSKFDEKTGISLVNGAHDTAKLAGLLENFIKKYVQCYGCGNPETDITITKTQMITLKCAACGFISDVDMRDKLTTFILKNPPEQKKSKDKAMRRAEKERLKEGEAADELKKLKKETKKKGLVSSKDGENSKRAAASKKKPKGSDEEHSSPPGSPVNDNEDGDDDGDDDGIQWQTDTSAEAARQRIQEQLSAATAEMVMLSTSDATSKGTNKSNLEKKNEAAKLDAEILEKPSTHDSLISEIKGMLKKGAKASELGPFLGSLTGSQQEIMDALFEALFEGIGKGFAKEVDKKKNYLVAAMEGEESQMCLLQAIGAFCEKCSGDAVKEVALVVKSLYDGDILEEEYIVKWYEEGLASKNKSSIVWKNMKPFVEWLQNAESEEE
ncbi:putative eukaryotic translation initiation factor 5-2 [Curcuma longa]|uniref:putative eukaryotic translation initiation factor 5-2 n=1 Tax=Curcuma longa TaxID=136217 RepID=UPI003D9DDF6C